MNDDDDSGGDFFVDLMKTLVALFFLCLFFAVIGIVVMELVA